MRNINSLAFDLALLVEHMTKQQFIELLINRSSDFKKHISTLPAIEPEVVMPEKMAAIHAAIADGDFGCKRESVRKLVSALTGLDIPSFQKLERPRIEYNGLAIVIPVNEKKHGDFINKPSLIHRNSSCLINADFEIVIMSDSNQIGDLQPVMDESVITKFASALYDKIKEAGLIKLAHEQTLQHTKHVEQSDEKCCEACESKGPSQPRSLARG